MSPAAFHTCLSSCIIKPAVASSVLSSCGPSPLILWLGTPSNSFLGETSFDLHLRAETEGSTTGKKLLWLLLIQWLISTVECIFTWSWNPRSWRSATRTPHSSWSCCRTHLWWFYHEADEVLASEPRTCLGFSPAAKRSLSDGFTWPQVLVKFVK